MNIRRVAFRGFLFGMTLQMAIGPVCFFIFTTASGGGFLIAEAGVVGVVIIDALYMALALFGVSKLLDRNDLKKFIGLTGALVIALFGIWLIFNGIIQAPGNTGIEFCSTTPGGAFLAALLLTASNPLTIIFWTGLFGAQIELRGNGRGSVIAFSGGCLGATLLFLSGVAVLGGKLHETLPLQSLPLLNVSVGIIFILYSIRLAGGQLRRSL